jgi:hypothetical protein
MLSSYAASFSSLIAADLAERQGVLPLHYVQVASNTQDFKSGPGLLRGLAVPVNIPDFETFDALTQALPDEVSAPRRTMLSNLLSDLMEASSRRGFRLRQSAQAYQTFADTKRGLARVYGTEVARGEFQPVFQAYVDAVLNRIVAFAAAYPSLYAADSQNQAQFYNYTSAVAQALADPASAPAIMTEIRGWAFPFALAEFLVTRNLACVVDIKAPGHDAHWANGEELYRSLAKFTLYGLLVERLTSAELGGGRSFLDQTTLALTTEFDRSIAIFHARPTDPPGTNHGASASVILTGRNIAQGRILGGIVRDPASPFGYTAPLGLNDDGTASDTARRRTTQAVFPTVLAAFGLQAPPEQFTGEPVCPPVLKIT